MSSNAGRIWQPSVQPTSSNVPQPDDSSRMRAASSTQELYTKTSLKTQWNSEQENLANRNRDILSASQAFNNSPRPFSKPPTPRASSSLQNLTPGSCESHQQVYQQAGETREAPSCATTSVGDKMAPKLVHNQYNSPLDLYSMSNIRKTIEAHTELIAPGLKGINFMKSDTPVNKQSEVYKLVREEEERERKSRRSPTPRPVSSSLLNSMSDTAHDARQDSISGSSMRYANSASNLEHRHTSHSHSNQELGSGEQATIPSSYSKPPSCSECGRTIVGPFAKVSQKYVHPQCFNCTTCGTSLKNNGYFTINDKMYCEIHAKQVANMMRIQFNFESKQNLSQSGTSYTCSSGPSHRSAGDEFAKQGQTSYGSTSLNGSQRTTQTSSGASPATISTMFADRSNSETSEDRREIRYTWKQYPASESSPSYDVSADKSRQEKYQTMSSQLSSHDQQYVKQSTMLDGAKGRGVHQERPRPGDRIPICVHCHAQIQGPYILAGKTTWCKHCSRVHFNCSSCKRSLLDIGFIEGHSSNYYCECCFEAYYAPVCFKCNIRIKGDCLNALGKQWHPSCFVCGHCLRPFGNSSFYLEDNVPYCERDWKLLFTTKCYQCSLPIEAGDRWIEALDKSFHTNCFKCTSCQTNLEGSTFYCRGGKPYCRLHVR